MLLFWEFFFSSSAATRLPPCTRLHISLLALEDPRLLNTVSALTFLRERSYQVSTHSSVLWYPGFNSLNWNSEHTPLSAHLACLCVWSRLADSHSASRSRHAGLAEPCLVCQTLQSLFYTLSLHNHLKTATVVFPLLQQMHKTIPNAQRRGSILPTPVFLGTAGISCQVDECRQFSIAD